MSAVRRLDINVKTFSADNAAIFANNDVCTIQSDCPQNKPADLPLFYWRPIRAGIRTPHLHPHCCLCGRFSSSGGRLNPACMPLPTAALQTRRTKTRLRHHLPQVRHRARVCDRGRCRFPGPRRHLPGLSSSGARAPWRAGSSPFRCSQADSPRSPEI